MKKQKTSMKINQIEKIILQSFFNKCFITILNNDNIESFEKLNGIVIPLTALLTEANLSLEYIKVEFDDLKDIKVLPVKAIHILEKRLATKFYKGIIIDNKPIMEHFLNMFEVFIRDDFPILIKNIYEVLKEADTKAKAQHIVNKATVH